MFFTSVSLFLGAFFLSFVLFIPSVKLSRAVGAIDVPSARKSHEKPTERAGGAAFFVAFAVFVPLLPISNGGRSALIAGCATIFFVGLLDDAISLSPFAKLCGQLAAVCVYYLAAIDTGGIESLIQGTIMLVWIVFITNATNLVDGLDGLAGGIAGAESLCLAILALIFNNTDIFLCSLLLLSVILGFLPRNFPRAKIFMGDCGALFLGFTLGTLSSRLVFESKSLLCFFSIMLIFRIPNFDTVQSFIRRALARKNPFGADLGHLHHRLIRLGFSKECAAMALVTLSLLFGLIGILICFRG